MSTTDQARSRTTVGQYDAESSYVDSVRDGWVLFAAVILAMLATLNIIYGIAALSDSRFFVDGATFILSDLNTYGWILIAMGTIQGFTAYGVWMRIKGIRWIGVAIAALNAILQMVFISAYPLWALSLFTLDILVIYGLVAYGARAGRAA